MANLPGRLPIVAIVGPTASGKTALSLDLAERLDGEIINADSMQFYRGMDIGTAKLPIDERRGIAHHLIDIMDVRDEASVAQFQADARRAIGEIRTRGRTPILVGGSGLYVRAALDVLELPPTAPDVRARLESEAETRGIAALRTRLHEVDPASAAKLTDNRRIIRALEVFEITGRTFTSFMPQREYAAPAVQIGVTLDREVLHERINQRVLDMARGGLLEEVAFLAGQGLREGSTAPHAIGYRQFLAVLDGQLSEPEAIESTQLATRQFAKRQLTWFRADPRVTWFNPLEHLRAASVTANVTDSAEAAIRHSARGNDRLEA